VIALREFLPRGLQFVISDNGTHFRSDAFAALAESANSFQSYHRIVGM
jgi:hypothetical protein